MNSKGKGSQESAPETEVDACPPAAQVPTGEAEKVTPPGERRGRPGKPLTLKRRLFVEAYLGPARGNATEAARVAGYAHPMQEGERLLRNAEIVPLVRARVEAVAMGADEVLRELARVARVPLEEVMGEPRLLAGKVRSLEILAKHHGLLKQAAKNPADAARSALDEMRARYPALGEAELRRIVSETFDIRESELVQ